MNFLIPDKEPKMTEAEIMKALECCITAKTFGDCSKMKCPASTKNGCRFYLRTDEEYENTIYIEILKDALDLINRKNAEIERLQKKDGAECPTCHGTGRIGTTDWLTKHMSAKQLAKEKEKAVAEFNAKIKAEAIKEFAERAKEESILTDKFGEVILVGDIDQIAKEMGVE